MNMDLKHEKTFNFTHNKSNLQKVLTHQTGKIQKLDNTVSQQAVGK